jgi:hypothetical protein
VHYDDLLNIAETERHTANSNLPVGYAEQETWSFPKWPRRFDSLVMKTKLTN